MDARKIFRMIKPHLDQIDDSQRKQLSVLISSGPLRITRSHRRTLPVTRAKEKLRKFCITEMAREQQQQEA